MRDDDYRFFVPVVFHNLRGYDSHLILHGYKKAAGVAERINCIPTNMKKFLSFSIENLRFIDSLQFLNASLDSLSKNLKRDDFCHTLRHSPADKVHMLLRKGVFCYDYWDCHEKALDVSLPPRAVFYSRLTEESVTFQDYWHAMSVWREFGIHNLGEYHDLYLKTDVFILADVFETFCRVCLKHYGLDAAHYFSSPGLAWDAMLKMTKVYDCCNMLTCLAIFILIVFIFY